MHPPASTSSTLVHFPNFLASLQCLPYLHDWNPCLLSHTLDPTTDRPHLGPHIQSIDFLCQNSLAEKQLTYCLVHPSVLFCKVTEMQMCVMLISGSVGALASPWSIACLPLIFSFLLKTTHTISDPESLHIYKMMFQGWSIQYHILVLLVWACHSLFSLLSVMCELFPPHSCCEYYDHNHFFVQTYAFSFLKIYFQEQNCYVI